MHLKIQKRTLAFLLALVLLLSTFASTAVVSVSAAETDVADTAADIEVAEEAADVEVAQEAAAVDVAETGVNYQSISGYTAPFGISVTTSNPYPWTIVDAQNGIMASSNQGVAHSLSYVKIVASFEGTLSFDYFSSGEKNYDFLCYQICSVADADSLDPYSDHLFWTKGTDNTSVTSLSGITTWGHASEPLEAGDALVMAFRKDGSGDKGADTAWIKNIEFETDVDPDNLSNSSISFSLVSPEGIDFSVSDTQGGEAKASFTGTQGDFGTFYFNHPADYSVVKVYRDAACTSLVASGDVVSIAYGDADAVYYVKLLKEWDSISGYTDPENVRVMVNTTLPYPWTTREVDGETQLISGNYNINSSDSYLRIYAEKEGVLSFSWHCTSEGTSDGLVYKVNDSTVGRNNKDAIISGSTDVWKDVSFAVSAGDSVYFDYYKDGSVHRNDDLGIVKNISLNTNIKNTTLTFHSDHGYVSTSNTDDSSNAVTSLTGIAGTDVAALYVIPDYANGWRLEGVYTTPDYQASSKVEPKSDTQYRTFTGLVYPEENTTYYVKYEQQQAVTYTFDFDDSIFTSVGVTRLSAYNNVNSLDKPYQSLSVDDTTESIDSGDSLLFYPGDRVQIDYTIDDNHKFTKLTYEIGAESGDYGTSPIFYAESPENGYTLTLNAMDISYQELSGYTAENVKVYTRPEYKADSSKTNYSWSASDGVLSCGNHNIGNSYSFLKLVAQHDGILNFDYRVSCESASWDYLVWSTNGVDPDDSHITGLNKYGNEVPWTTVQVNVTAGTEYRFNFRKDGSGNTGDDIAQLRNIGLYYGEKTISLTTNDNTYGTVYATGLTEGKAEAGNNVTVTATPAENYSFVSWQVSYDNGATWDKASADDEYTFMVTDNAIYKAMFAPQLAEGETAIAQIKGTDIRFADLNTAMQFVGSGDVVVLITNYTQTTDLTIPDGVTLLVPFSSAYTVSTDNPATVAQQNVTLTDNAYVTLTLAAGKKITTNGGSICVNSTVPSTTPNSPDKWNGNVVGAYGLVVMESGSQIILNGSSHMYVYGFVIGDGDVLVNDTSDVYEHFAIEDWPGGTASSSMSGTQEFPFNQYYIQNIECRLTIQSTAREYVFISIYIPSWGDTESLCNEFVGPTGMFRLDNGASLTKYYNPAEDKMYYTINGDATLGSIEVYGFSSNAYYLPINNADVTISDGTLTANNKVIFLPGSSLNIDDDATLNVVKGTGYNDTGILVFADKGFTGYSFPGNKATNSRIPIRFTPSRTPRAKTYTAAEWATVESASIDNNGTVIVEDGASLTATAGGANFYSSTGEGTYIINGANAAPTLSIHNTNNGSPSVYDQVAPATLQDDTTGEASGESLATTERWFNGDGGVYTMREVNGVKEWGDFRDVTFLDSNGNQLGSKQKVSVREKDDIHDYDDNENIPPVARFDGEGMYWKYVMNGSWNYVVDPNNSAKLIATPNLTGQESIFEKHSLSLNGDIGTNFYLFDAPQGAAMEFSWGKKFISQNNYSDTEKYTATDTTVTERYGLKEFSVNVAAKELNDEITANLVLDGNVIATETYKGTDYAYEVLADDNQPANLKTLVRSLLIYSAKAQTNFNYNTDELADYKLSDKSLTALTNAQKAALVTNDLSNVPDYLEYYGCSLNLDSKTAYTMYFVDKNSEMGALSAKFESDDVPLKVDFMRRYGAARCDIMDIPAARITDNIIMNIDDSALTLNIGDYIKNVLESNNTSGALKDMVTSLYQYNQAAIAFFG